MKTRLLENETDLAQYLEAGCKPQKSWRIGTEHEKFVFHRENLKPLTHNEKYGIAFILSELSERFAWEPIFEAGKIIALKDRTGASITLEPGGQLELSGAPLASLHETCLEVRTHLSQIKEIAEPHNIGFLGMGFTPLWHREEISWMPKSRYIIMRGYMPKVGNLGLDMMLRTATVQVNLDFASEQDMVQKFRVALALQPLATALFANSPFTEGTPNGFLSFRSQIWNDTDPNRCGMLPFVFEEGMGFERYVQYMLDVPMYFVERNGQLLNAAGQSFRDFLKGRLPALPGEKPTIKDWEDHLTTAFPEVRLKRFLEMRGADGGPWCSLCALPAFWTGILYDNDALNAAWDLVKNWSVEERQCFRMDAPRFGLKTKTPAGTAHDLAARVLEIAECGLQRRAVYNETGMDESVFLTRLFHTVETGKTPAEEKLEKYQKEWKESVLPIFTEYIY